MTYPSSNKRLLIKLLSESGENSVSKLFCCFQVDVSLSLDDRLLEERGDPGNYSIDDGLLVYACVLG